MRVLVVTNDYPPASGGIQRYIEDLLRHVPWETHVAAPAHPRSTPHETVSRYDRALTPTRRAARWVTTVVEHTRPDLILFAAFPLALVGPRVSERTGVPYALLLHGAETTIPSAVPILRDRYRAAMSGARARLAVSRYTRARVEERFGVAVTWVGAGVDTDVFTDSPLPHDGFVVGCVGRFVRRKGHHLVLEAVASMRTQGIDARATMVGWGSGERRLRRTARDVPTRFLLHASEGDLIDAYRGMDVFAMPVRSRWGGLEVEGLGLVYLEAAACGLPVIAGPSGGAPETVEEGVTGMVVRTRRELTDALLSLARDANLTATMGTAGRARVERDYTWDAVAGRIQEAFADG
jgi:phosphatidyl-myo-inositol dimannoside synthase